MQAHDPNILVTLPLEIARLGRISQAECGRAYARSPEHFPPFDGVLVTGDISTDATNDERFRFAFQYLTAEVPVAQSGIYAREGVVGLGIDRGRLFTVPGNHDKMRETAPTRFNSAFSETPAVCNYVRVIRPHDVPVVLIGLDTNAYGEGNIAVGEVDDARLAWLANVFKGLESGSLQTPSGTLNKEEAATAVRCLVLHHHLVDLGPYVRRFRFSRRFTILEGARRLLDLLTGRVDIVFHGHEHYPACFEHTDTGIVMISAGSASEWHKKIGANSFYVATLRDDHSLRIAEHVWWGTGFKANAPQTFRLRRLSADASTQKSA